MCSTPQEHQRSVSESWKMSFVLLVLPNIPFVLHFDGYWTFCPILPRLRPKWISTVTSSSISMQPPSRSCRCCNKGICFVSVASKILPGISFCIEEANPPIVSKSHSLLYRFYTEVNTIEANMCHHPSISIGFVRSDSQQPIIPGPGSTNALWLASWSGRLGGRLEGNRGELWRDQEVRRSEDKNVLLQIIPWLSDLLGHPWGKCWVLC